jgi:hypothetical protein
MGPVMAAALANLRKRFADAAELGERDTTMNIDDVAQVERVVASGKYGRADFHGALTALAKRERRPEESDAQAYSRVATQHPIGKKLMLGYSRAPIGTDAPVPLAKAEAPEPPLTPSLQALNALRDKIAGDNPTLTKEQAFSAAMATPEGKQHYRQYRSEVLAGAHR